MKKSDLKSKMIVKQRNGICHLVVDDILVGTGLYLLEDYNDDLTCKEHSEAWDIMEVFGYYNPYLKLNNDLGHNTDLMSHIRDNKLNDNYKLLWFRREYLDENGETIKS